MVIMVLRLAQMHILNSAMLEASASALQWEYFEYVYKEMVLSVYQLDQNKLAYLLVEASRAGKVNYLCHDNRAYRTVWRVNTLVR